MDTINNIIEFIYFIDIYKHIYSSGQSSRFWLKNDPNGVVVILGDYFKKKFKTNDPSIGQYFYHPCNIAQAAFGYYDNYVLTKKLEFKKLFLAQINWLEDNSKEYRNAYIYPFPYATKGFGTKPGWISGMYQGEILSCFVKAYVLTNDNKYLFLAKKVYNSYSLELGDEYGFKTEDKYGLWFEESMLIPARHILNGFIFAVFGLYDYYRVSGRSDVKELFDRAINTIKKTLPEYDMGFWSYYDLQGTIASYSYHEDVHIPQLRALHQITQEAIFKSYADKWEIYNNSWFCQLRKKIYTLRYKMLKSGIRH